MDEIWQRHRTFILQVLVIGLVFLIGLLVMSGSFSEENDPARIESSNRVSFQAIQSKPGPSRASIDVQKDKAVKAEQTMRKMAAEVASLKSGDEYVRENLEWIAKTIKADNVADKWFGLYKGLPQTCLSSVREEVRVVLVGRAARQGRQLDETLGLVQAFEDDDVPQALHGLAIVADLVSRGLDDDDILAVGDLRIGSTNVISSDLPWVSGSRVHISFTGQPGAVAAMIRSFNSVENHMKRMTVVQEIESISRPRKEDDVVRAQLALYALQFKGAEAGQGK